MEIKIEQITLLIISASWAVAMWFRLREQLHILQLEDYEPRRMIALSWKRQSSRGLKYANFHLFPAVLLVNLNATFWAGVVLWVIGCVMLAQKLRKNERTAKKKLVMTPRAKGIFRLGFIISIVIPSAIYAIFGTNAEPETYIVILFFINELAFLPLSLSVLILQPFENRKQAYYINDAKRIISEINPLVIGITGSYGKTGTKEILSSILAEKYNIFRPPGSYNTLMGVTRAIREGLRPQHEAFVAEMGAYRIGSIEKLCRLVKPTHGIITTIGVQHLERFGSQKVIQQAKGELIRSLPGDGIAVLNGDDPLCREIGESFGGKVVYFRTESVIAGEAKQSTVLSADEGLLHHDVPRDDKAVPTVSVKNIKIKTGGSDFDLCFPDGEEQPAHLSLLGRTAISNAVAAAAMADRLGVRRDKIVRALNSIPHVRHRLEPIRREGGITVIDDAFNSNPIGAAGALEVLSMAEGRRILVTPGMIELGDIEADENREFGRKAATACDLAVLIGGKRVEPIRTGLLEAGFDAQNIRVTPTLNEALEQLKSYLEPGDTMLLENDLPDQYDGM